MKKVFILFLIASIFCRLSGQIIPKDKQMHMYAGAVVSSWGTLTSNSSNGFKRAMIGAAWGTTAGVGKELADMGGFGTPEWKDFGSTVLGSVISVVIIEGLQGIIKHRKIHKTYKKETAKQKAQLKLGLLFSIFFDKMKK